MQFYFTFKINQCFILKINVMNRKIKLTELRQLETSKEEMDFVKGGTDSIFCKSACHCESSCTGNANDAHVQQHPNSSRNAQNNSTLGWAIDLVGGPWIQIFG